MPLERTCYYCLKTVKNQFRRHLSKHGDVDMNAYTLLTTFLETPEPKSSEPDISVRPHMELARLIKEMICKTEGLSNRYFLSAEECQVKGVTDEDILNDCLHSFDKNKSTVYYSDEPCSPQKVANLIPVLAQLKEPSPARVAYATNLGPGDGVRRPQRFAGEATESEMKTHTNITPEGTFIDLHIDQGYEGITLLGMGCVKLWVVYPPTEHNLAIWDTHRKSREIFKNSWDQLQDGKVAVQTGKEAILLIPGLLHLTFTLKGGIAYGITWITESCLKVTPKLLEIEDRHFRDLGSDDLSPFLESVLTCMKREGSKQDALRALCKMPKIQAVKKNELFNKIKAEIGPGDCFHCRRRWRNHWFLRI
ncbi:unnamed protein product [Fusarium langsethiae]|nr:unnamed protein product [Fusarium langsethiae]GKU16553.1 unnamed protein product [Fusarium langsethiae]